MIFKNYYYNKYNKNSCIAMKNYMLEQKINTLQQDIHKLEQKINHLHFIILNKLNQNCYLDNEYQYRSISTLKPPKLTRQKAFIFLLIHLIYLKIYNSYQQLHHYFYNNLNKYLQI